MLKEIVISSYVNYEREADFNSEANILAASFSQEIRQLQYDSKNIEKFELHLTNTIIGKEIVTSDWLLSKQFIFNFDEYWRLSKNEKQDLLLGLVKEQLIQMAMKFEWDTPPINAVYDTLLKEGIKREAFWTQETRFEEFTVSVFFSMNINSMDVFLEFFDGDDVSRKKILVAKLWPNDYYLGKFLGTIYTSKDEIIIESEDKDFSVSYGPRGNTIKYIGTVPRWLTRP